MVPRILSIVVPVLVYATLAFAIRGLWSHRKTFDWLAVVPALAGLAASFIILDPVHRLFFDEDIYISIAHNLTRAPIAQITLLGGPDEIAVSTYYKQPPGWPILLSILFMATGRTEMAAFVLARIMYAFAIAAVYMLAKAAGGTRAQALTAAIVFGATPVCFWFSASPGTDIAAALFTTLGLLGIISGNRALAAGALAMAAQIRLEMIAIAPAIFLTGKLSVKWKALTLALIVPQFIHVAWVLSVEPVLAKAEGVESAFAISHVAGNLLSNGRYLLNPMLFPAVATISAILSMFSRSRWSGGLGVKMLRGIRLGSGRIGDDQKPAVPGSGALILVPAALLIVYLLFYAGSFDVNPRYSIQLLTSLSVIGATAFRHSWVILLALILPYTQSYNIGSYVEALAADHAFSTEFVSRFGPQDLVVSSEHEMFLNQGMRAMSSVLASEQPERLEAEIAKDGKVIYHSGVRSNVAQSQSWIADRWLKSNYALEPIDAREAGGMRIAFYEVLLKDLYEEARQ